MASEPSNAPPSRARARPDTLTRLAVTMQRLDECEDILASGLSPRRTAGEIARRWGIGRRQAQEYVNAVQVRWATETANLDRDARRASMLARIRHTYRVAMERKRGIVYSLGDWKQDVKEVPDPDLRSAGNMLELECRLFGLMDQLGAGPGDIPGDVLKMVHLHYFQGQPQEPALEATATVVKPEDEP